MTNIAIVLEATLGGTRKHVTDLLLNMQGNDFSLTYIYSRKRADKTFLNDISLLRKHDIDCIDLPMSNNIYDPVNLSCIFSLVKIFKKKNIQVLHLHGAIAGTLGRLAAVFCRDISKIIYSPHGGVLHKVNSSVIGKLFLNMERMLVSNRLHFVAVSSDEKEMISRLLHIRESAISLVHNGIELHDEYANEVISKEALLTKRKQLDLEENDFVLLYPAMFLEAKGHRNFFYALKRIPGGIGPKIKILLAGDGPLHHEIKELVAGEAYSEQVRFLGFVEKIKDLFLVADAVILPSNNEAFGYVLLEAMYYGKPIFATAVGGIKDIVEPGKNGFLYAPGNIQEMIADINTLSVDTGRAGITYENTLQLLEQKFNIKISANRIATLYKSV